METYILGGLFMKQLYLYGIGGAEDGFRVIRYREIDQSDLSALTLRYEATDMLMHYRSIQRFFVIDNRPGLAKLCAQSIKTRDVEKALIFLDILEKQGLEIKI
jgi:hypothetical protein